MSNIKLFDLNVVITDKAMLDVYNSDLLDSSNSKIVSYNQIEKLNLYSNPKDVIELSKKLGNYFFFVAGSSNFHHIDIANILRIKSQIKKKLQLVLFDHHMDCSDFVIEKDILNCGNWISYAYKKNLISRVVMIGTKDFRKTDRFDFSLEKNGDLSYHPNINNCIDSKFLNPDSPTYISIDTDILSEPSDWERGPYSLNTLLNSPIWEQLSNYNLVGASILGHVTDNRKIIDLFKTNYQNKDMTKTKNPLSNQWEYLIYTIFPKLWSSLTIRPLPLDKQLAIIVALYQKIQSIRNK